MVGNHETVGPQLDPSHGRLSLKILRTWWGHFIKGLVILYLSGPEKAFPALNCKLAPPSKYGTKYGAISAERVERTPHLQIFTAPNIVQAEWVHVNQMVAAERALLVSPSRWRRISAKALVL